MNSVLISAYLSEVPEDLDKQCWLSTMLEVGVLHAEI